MDQHHAIMVDVVNKIILFKPQQSKYLNQILMPSVKIKLGDAEGELASGSGFDWMF